MKKRKRRFALANSPESLERRSMLAANVLDVAQVAWNGQLVDAVRNEYVLRMPQLNAATAKSPVDYQSRTPVVPAGWSTQNLGSGFFKLTAPGATQAALTTWARQQGANYIEVNRVGKYYATPNDPLYANASNWGFSKIAAPAAWDTGTGTSSTIVAVMDSGVDYRHPDLAANMWRNPNEITGDGIDNDKNGFVDDVFGINAVTGSGDPMDRFGHGTFCAGLIGAVGNNAVGMAGVNWTVKIMALSIGDMAPTSSGAIVAANYIAAQKAAGQNIASVNCSFGVGYSKALEDAFALMGSSGIVVAAAAGNESSNNDQSPRWPANLEVPEIISVAASTPNDSLADFSNFGTRTVDLAAPGDNVLSTRLAGSVGYTPVPGNDAYGVASGTSFAAPLVAGTAGLLKSLKPTASASQVKAAILNGVDKVSSLNGLVLTGGRLNVKNAVDLILSTTGTVPAASFKPGQSLTFVEGNGTSTLAEIWVTLDRPADPGKSASVWYETRPGGSAISGTDFVAQSGFLTFAAGEVEKSFRIRIVGDRTPEQREQFAVRLDQAKSKGVTVATAQANVVIVDDDEYSSVPGGSQGSDPLLPRLTVDVKRDATNTSPPTQGGGTPTLTPRPMREGQSGTFVVSLDKTSDKTVTVKYRTNQPVLVPANTALAGVDYTATAGTLTFRPGERTKEFTVAILADRVIDDNETFDVILSEPTNAQLAGPGGRLTAGGAITAVITDVPFIPPPQPGFQITVTFPDSSLTPSQQRVFQQAASRWQEIIVGDLPNVTDPATGQVIDDILIVATAPAIDGVGGVLGQARPTDFRPGARGLPWKGEMQFDTADVPATMADGTFLSTILHEMAHSLGFGSVWQQFGLVKGVGTTSPIYVGANALREYRTLFGAPRATGVPVEATGGAGTAGGHWSERILVNELMTGFAERAGVPTPISRITVGQFQDLGYQVNYGRADVYAKPTPLPAPPPGSGGGVINSRMRLAVAAAAPGTTTGTAPLTGPRPIVLAPARPSPVRSAAASPLVSQPVVSPAAVRSSLSVAFAAKSVADAPATGAGVSAGLPGRTAAFATLGRA